ncbi:MAG: NAD/NADP octopine/nopaline dehydrogenase family protein [Lentisphaerae bacterium]|nr:NAD/NADP octopine/nopaline dehydrogenase family protein [Lentisphaerota bacterium]
MSDTIAILGCGAGGMAMAADLTLAGLRVHLFELPEFAENVKAIQVQGGIELKGASRTGRVMPARVTTDPAAALADAELVLVSVPVFGHQRMVEAVAPHVRDGQFVLFNTGYWAALRFRKALTQDGRRKVVLAESTLLVYAVRKVGPATVHVDGVKQDFPVAALPATETGRLLDLVRRAYPQARPMRSVLEVSLENLNPMFHPAITLLNAGELERTKVDFGFYREGCTPAVGRVIDALDAERRALGSAFGLPDLVSAAGWLHRYYGASGTTAYEAIHSCPAYANFRWPTATAIHYVHEDVPYAFVPFVSIAQQLGVATPVTRGIVELCGTAFNSDFWAEGPDAAKLGLSGMDAAAIRRLVERE